MAILDAKVRKQVKQVLEQLTSPVKLVMFTQEADALECEVCEETRALVEEVAELSGKLKAEIHDFKSGPEAVKQYGVDKIPAIAIVGDKDYGVRYYGIPAGYEFGSFLQDIVQVSRGDSGLAPKSRELLARLKKPLHLQVFVTPT